MGTVVRTRTPQYVIDRLSSNTDYKVYVQSLCSNGGTSMSVSDTFHTLCGSLTQDDLPYRSDFENPARFALSDYIDDDDSPTIVPFYSCNRVIQGTLSTSYSVSSHHSISLEQSGTLTLPYYAGDLSTLMVRFKALKRCGYSEGKIEVGVLDRFWDLASYTRLAYINIDDKCGQWHTYTVGLSNYFGSGHVVIKCSTYNVSVGNRIFIDDVSLESLAVCPSVINTKAQKVWQTAALLTWKPAPGFSHQPLGYKITYTGNGGRDSVVVNSRQALVEHLAPATNYTAAVSPVCAAANGEADTVHFKTLCSRGGLSNYFDGQLPTVDLWVLPLHYFWGNSVSQTIFTASELYRMGLVPGNILGCAFVWHTVNSSMAGLDNLFFTLHLDTTSRSAYYESRQDRIWLPIDSSTQYYNGLHASYVVGEEQLLFDHPFYWDGVSNIVMTFINNQMAQSRRYTPIRSPIVPVSDTVSLLTYRDNVPYNENNLPDTCLERLPYRPDVRFICDCDTTGGGCGRPLLYADSVFGTTVRLRWSSGGGETAWTVEHCDTSRVWIVDDSAATARSYLYTALDPDVEYYFRVTAHCDDTVIQNRRDTTRVVTQCEPLAIPLRDSLEGWPAGITNPSIPNCWYRGAVNMGTRYYYPYITTDFAYSGSRSLCFYSNHVGQSYLVLPAVGEDLRTLELSFRMMTECNPYSREIIVGVMSDPDDATTFWPLQTVTTEYDGIWEQMDVPLTSSPLAGGYVALFTPIYAESKAYIDNIELDRYNPCRRLKRFRVSGVSPTSATLAWDADAAGCAATVEYGAAGFEPGTGTRVYTTDCGITITGLSSDSTYDFYGTRTCDSSALSRQAGPVQATVGRWNIRPHTRDTMVLCGIELYDDSGPGINYSPGQMSRVTIVPQDSGTYVSIAGTYTDNNYYGWRDDSIAVYDGMDRTAPCLLNTVASGELAVGPFTATNPQGALTVCFRSIGQWGGVGLHLHVSCLDSMPPLCPVPTGLNVKDTTYNSATVFWADTGLFEFAYKPASQRWWPHPSRDTASRYLLTGLHSIESYDWHVRRVCSLNVSDWAVSTFTTTQSPCTRPVQFRVSDTGMSDATLSWRSTADGEWQLRVLGMTLASPAGIDTVVAAPPVMVTGLLPHTEYRAVVRHLCDATSASEWTDTLCFTTRHDTTLAITALDGQDFRVRVYPNPLGTGVQATVVVSGASDEAVLSLYDLSGRRLRRHAESCPEQCTLQFDVSDLAQGTYFVKVHTRTKSAVAKLVIMR